MAAYRLIKHFGTDHSPSGAPCPAVFEDSVEGGRLLLVEDLVPVEVWDEATALGVLGLFRITDAGVRYVPVEEFIEYRTEAKFGANFALADQHWGEPVEHGLTVVQLAEHWYAGRTSTNPFVHLHTHSEFSQLDGLSTMAEIGAAVLADGQSAVGVTDHGTCAGHPALQQMASEVGITPVFGIEAYFTDDRHSREDQFAYWHLCLYAKDDQGLKNLWGLSTESFRDGFYGKPRIDWDSLRRWRAGLICSTGCLRGPVLYPFGQEHEQQAIANLSRLGDIFGEDLFAELHTNHLPAQVTGNNWLAGVARKYQVPVIAAVDSHYPSQAHQLAHKVWLGVTTSKDVVTDDSDLFAGGQDYHLMTAAEVREALDYLGPDTVKAAIQNTGALAAGCTAEIRPQVAKPVFSKPTEAHPDPVVHDVERFVDAAFTNFDNRITARGLDPQPYLDRIKHEGPLLIDKEYCGYYLICRDFVTWAKDHGILVGPGRGSGAASLFAYLMRITEIDPVEGDLLLDRFMTKGRKSLPDFDIDFPSTRADEVITYVQQRWGHEHVARVGSHIRLQSKGAFRGVQTALASQLPPQSFAWVDTINKLVDAAEASTAGLGLSWDELMDQIGDLLAGFRTSMPELFFYAEMFHHRLRTYGKHAAGFVIDPDANLEAELPMRRSGDDGPMVTQWDMEALEYIGKVKFDFLRLATLDIVQGAIDRIREETGHEINLYDFHDEFDDPMIFEMLGDGWTMGVFQIETSLGTRTTKQLKPVNRSQLADVITIGRPGPLRSGLDRVYLRRRNGEEAVDLPDPRLKTVLGRTFGTMLYQEDIMAICTVLAGYDADEADHVRKILGKKKVELVEAEGQRFVSRAVANNTDRDVATKIWSQMAEFARYCVAGDTQISLAGSNAHSDGTVSIQDLYRRLHAPHGPRRLEQQECDGCGRELAAKATVTICPACRSWRTKFHDSRGVHGLGYYADDRIRPVRILDVVERDKQRVTKITLADGKFITATPNHQHVTDKGYRRVDELAIGDKLLVDDGYEPQKYEPKDRLTKGERQRFGAVNRSYGEANYGYVDGGHTVWSQWRATHPKVCEQCGTDWGRIELAHLDGDHTNNVESNFAWLCASCHKAYDYAINDRRRRWQKGHLVGAVEIVEIEDAGVQPTYDMIMESPHNFVANKIITSNSFNRAHAYSYATVSLWGAWLKTHYVRQFLAEAMTVVQKDRIPQFVTEVRRLGYSVLPPDINDSKAVFSAKDLVIRYGFASVLGIGAASTEAILAGQPYESYDDFLERKGAANMGVVRKLVAIGAFDALHPNRRALEARLIDDTTGVTERCVNKTDGILNEHNLPCTFDWSSEPLKIGRSGKVLAASAQLKPPKKCTKACRHYTPRGAVDYSHLPNYSDEQVRDREIEMLGIYLTSSPFDAVPPHVLSEMTTAEDLVIAERGIYPAIAMITGVRNDPKGRDFGYASFATPSGDLSAVVFSPLWGEVRPQLSKGRMCFITIEKTGDDRYRLESFGLVRRFNEEELRDRQAEKIVSGNRAG